MLEKWNKRIFFSFLQFIHHTVQQNRIQCALEFIIKLTWNLTMEFQVEMPEKKWFIFYTNGFFGD